MKTSILAAAFSTVLLCTLSVMAEDSAPKGWSIQGSKSSSYDIKLDPGQKSEHGNSISLQSKGESDGMGTLMQVISADDFKGKRVRFSGYIKGMGVKSWAGLWMRINKVDGAVSVSSAQKRTEGKWQSIEHEALANGEHLQW